MSKFRWEIEVLGSVEVAKPSILDSNGDPIRLSTSLIIRIVIDIPNLGPPTFKVTLKDIQVKVGELQILKFPSIVDPDSEDSYKVEMCDFGDASTFS